MSFNMQRNVIRAAVAVIFLSLLLVPLIYKRVVHHRRAADSAHDRAEALARYGCEFQDLSRERGRTFVHRAPILHPKPNPIIEQLRSMGAAVSIADFDRDGWDDIYVAN